MKSLIKLYVLLLALINLSAEGAIGCMNNSRNLTQMFDYKNYEFVQCSCPCGSSSRYQILADRGLCRECRHYRNVKPMRLIKGTPPTTKQPLSENIIARYFQEQGSLFF